MEFFITGRVGADRNDNFYFHSFSGFPYLSWIEKKQKSGFLIFWIFLLFFFEFPIMVRVGTDRNDNFNFHCFSGFPNLFLAWKEAKIMFFKFLNYFAFFLEFLITGRVWTDRNGNFYFHSFSVFPNLFLLEKKQKSCFLIFWIFLPFFWNSLQWVGYELIGTIIFIVTLSRAFLTFFGMKRSKNHVFNFLNFFAFILEFLIMSRVGTDRNDNFYFHSFPVFPNLFWLEKKPQWCFWIFWIFLQFFWDSL